MTGKLFEELRTDLSLADLTLVTDDSLPSIQQFLRETIIKQAARAAPHWAAARGDRRSVRRQAPHGETSRQGGGG